MTFHKARVFVGVFAVGKFAYEIFPDVDYFMRREVGLTLEVTVTAIMFTIPLFVIHVF